MQYAYCQTDNHVWEAFLFSQQPASVLSEKRNNLLCTECGALAWFRRESTHGRPAHFCAHHEPHCELKAEYVAVDEDRGDASEAVEEVKSSGDIVVRLDKEKGGDIDVRPANDVPNGQPWQAGRSYVVKGGDRFSNQEFTLKRVLHRLVQSPNFRSSTSRIMFYKKENEPFINGRVCDVTRAFSDITRADENVPKFFWGPITSAGRTADGKIWLNSSPQYQSVSVAIFPDIAEKFLEAFNIEDLDDLAGAHVLVFGSCMYTGAQQQKPIIWCGALHQIVIRRYKAANLQRAG